MSDYMPFEIQLQIIERLPVRSLIQFRVVSKAWKSLIDSSEFIARYSARQNQPQHLLIRYHDPVASEEKYVTFADDDSFPVERFDPTLPLFVKKLYDSIIVGSCQGLFCLYGYYLEPGDSFRHLRTEMAVLWNPSIRKSVAVVVPKVLYRPYQAGLGFGICPRTSDPKIIHVCKGYEIRNMTYTSWLVKVFTLSSGAWKSRSSHLPRNSICFKTSQAVIDKFLYWSASETISIDGGFQNYWLIMSFDLINDEFREVHLPDSLALNPAINLSIFKLRESLAVVEFDDTEMQGYGVWVMEDGDGVLKSFKKLFTIHSPHALSINTVLGFRKSGEPVLEVKNYHEIFSRPVGLPVYEPYSEHINNIGILGTEFSFSVQSYMETLVLLNAPDFSSYLGKDDVDDDDFLLSL